jgi:carboxypeptidase family protein
VQSVEVRALRGRVVDPSGAVVANTKVKVVERDETGGHLELELRTDERGEFLANVPDGRYETSFAAPGFWTAYVTAEVVNEAPRAWRGFEVALEIGMCQPMKEPPAVTELRSMD